MNNRKNKSPIICRCNNVNRETIEQAIREGCDTMNKIFDATTAGVGPCGGSCRRKIKPMLDHYLETGAFPEKIVEDLTGKEPKAEPGPEEKSGSGPEVKKDPTSSDENQ